MSNQLLIHSQVTPLSSNTTNACLINCSFTPSEDETNDNFQITISRLHHGINTDFIIAPEFFGSHDYKSIVKLQQLLSELIEPGATVKRGEKSIKIERFAQGIDWLMQEGKRGIVIQRYKGLGEMNPEQLWETTMDPETRRMLQVNIEDAVQADQTFTTLMGDQVEPRRKFIEENALAADIDI